MVLDASLLNTQHYKVLIKAKVEKSMERSSAPPIHLGVVAIKREAFRSPLTIFANFTYFTHQKSCHSSAENINRNKNVYGLSQTVNWYPDD